MNMSKITNINDTPMVSPKDATILALKNGKMARCDFSNFIAIIEKIQNMNVDEIKNNFEVIKNNFISIENEIKNLEERYNNINKVIETRLNVFENAINELSTRSQNNISNTEQGEEISKAKSVKKSKKQPETTE